MTNNGHSKRMTGVKIDSTTTKATKIQSGRVFWHIRKEAMGRDTHCTSDGICMGFQAQHKFENWQIRAA